jgi:hypothetical protein
VGSDSRHSSCVLLSEPAFFSILKEGKSAGRDNSFTHVAGVAKMCAQPGDVMIEESIRHSFQD